jgi:hypothetical protein
VQPETTYARLGDDLVAGSEVALEDLGSRPLKGVEGDWQLVAVAGG